MNNYPSTRIYGFFECRTCRAICEKHAPTQRYCPPCSEQRDVQRKNAWHKKRYQEHRPGDAERRSAARATRQSVIVLAGSERSIVNRQEVTFPRPEIDRYCMVRVPFDYALSKNAIWRSVARGHVYLRRESRAARDNLCRKVRGAAAAMQFVERRVWVGIKVEKPDFRGDAINFVDSICDAVKDAIGIDDRWFSLMFLDWSVVKTNPQISVFIGQEFGPPLRVCSHCGRELPYGDFTRAKNARSGIGRACKECRRVYALDRDRPRTEVIVETNAPAEGER